LLVFAALKLVECAVQARPLTSRSTRRNTVVVATAALY
jgi:hypothetical protein